MAHDGTGEWAWRRRLRGAWARWRWPAIVALAVAASALGFVGHRKVAAARREAWTWTDCAYSTLRLFFLKARTVEGLSWELDAARWLAPAVAAYTLWAGLGVVFRKQLDRLRPEVDDIAQAHDLVDAEAVDVREHGVERDEVRV